MDQLLRSYIYVGLYCSYDIKVISDMELFVAIRSRYFLLWYLGMIGFTTASY